MIGTSFPEFVFIRVCILFLHYITPVALIYSLLRLFYPLLWPALETNDVPRPLGIWLFTETIFFIGFFLPYKYYLQRPATHPKPPPREKREELFKQCNEHVNDPEKYLSQWFSGAKSQQIKYENLSEFFAWAFLNTAKPQKEDEEEIKGYIKAMEVLLGRDIPQGRGSAKSLRLTLGNVECLHRSLLWYLCVGVVDTITCCSMLYNGFHFHRTSLTRFFTLFPLRPLSLFTAYKSPATHLTYWHRPHTSKSSLPVLFIHGIGIGLYPYTNFLRDLNNTTSGEKVGTEIGIIALEIMPVSFRLTHPALEKDVMVREILSIVKKHGWSRFILASHSYGSIISTHLLKSPLTSALVGPVVLVDPVSFLLHLPDVAYNFTVRQPSRANEHQLWYFASKDIGVAHTLARSFFWSENIIWKEDLGLDAEKDEEFRDVTVALSGKDLISDTKSIRRYLMGSASEDFTFGDHSSCASLKGKQLDVSKNSEVESEELKSRLWKGSGLDLIWFEHLDHAQVFDGAKTRRLLVDAIRTYSAKRYEA